MTPNSGPPRIKDVAALAGVSQSLVSRILNNDASLIIRQDTRQAVLDAVRELDYVPNSVATALRKSRTNSIGLVLKHVTSPMFTEIVGGAQRAAAEDGCVLLLIDADDVESGSSRFGQMIKAQRVDGLLLQGGYGPGDELLLAYTSAIPSVIVNSVGTALASGVRLQDEEAARIATEHLIARGHRDIVFVAGEPSMASDMRMQGFSAALENAGIALPASAVVAAGWEAQEGFAAALRVLESGRRPTAIEVANSGAALGVFSAIQRSGFRIPEDISVIAIHDIWVAGYLNPPLSTVRLPLFQLGYHSVKHLMQHVAHGKPEDRVITDPAPELILRGSTREL